MSEVREYIEILRGFEPDHPVWNWLLDHGIDFNGRVKPRGYAYRAERMCFANSWNLAKRSQALTYVEGYAWGGIMPIHHAWCIDPKGKVVDVTWRARDEVVESDFKYLGIPIRQTPDLLAWWARKYDASVLFDLPRLIEGGGIEAKDVFHSDFIFSLDGKGNHS